MPNIFNILENILRKDIRKEFFNFIILTLHQVYGYVFKDNPLEFSI